MKRSLPFFVLSCLFLATSPVRLWADGDLAPTLRSGKLFSEPLQSTAQLQGEAFSWVEKDVSLRYPSPQFTLGSQTLGETLFYTKEGKPTKVVCSLYNRGDQGRLSDAAFIVLLKSILTDLNRAFESQATPRNRKSDPTRSTYDIGGYLWKHSQFLARIDYSVTTQNGKTVPTAEYIRLTVIPVPATPDKTSTTALSGNSPLRSTAWRKNPRSNVQRDAQGTCEIKNIPMVDQGSKGYCAAATTARIMGYYGFEELDQHQIAQWALTDNQGGTNIETMMRGIKRVLHDQYRFNVYEFERLEYKDLMKLFERYNTLAKRENKSPLNPMEFMSSGGLDLNQALISLNPNLLRKTRAGNDLKNDLWFKKIKSSIDQGVPVAWSVQLGLIPEADLPQSQGGHMRLIIGYGGSTPSQRFILYSDSWGAGHERKSMPLQDAITITTGLFTIASTAN